MSVSFFNNKKKKKDERRKVVLYFEKTFYCLASFTLIIIEIIFLRSLET